MGSMIWHGFLNWFLGLGGIGGAVAIVAWALFAVTPAILLPFRSLVLQVAIVATVFSFAWGYATTTGYKAGYHDALNAVIKHSGKVSAAGEKAWKDVKECFDSGGEWNVEASTCVR